MLINGRIGSGVSEVEVDRRTLSAEASGPSGAGGGATRIEASHNGYVSRYGLVHRRILILRDAGYHIGKSYKVWSPGTPVDAPFGGQAHAYEKSGRASPFSGRGNAKRPALPDSAVRSTLGPPG